MPVKFKNSFRMAVSNEKSGQNTLFAEYMKITAVVALYWYFCSYFLAMLVFKKLITFVQLEAPLFITWYQCAVSVLLCLILGTLAKLLPKFISFPEFSIDHKICREILPLSVVFVAMITFNNLCLKYVGVSFYYIGRSLTTVFNVMCTYLILGEKTSLRAIACCGVIIAGFLLGVNQEDVAGTLSIAGVIYGVLASLSVALNAIYTKKMLPLVSDNIWRLTLYNNLNACVLFVPLMIVFGEVPLIVKFPLLLSVVFWALMTAGGVFGFGMSFVTGLQIQVTSALTHNISGTAKAAAQTVLAVLWFHEVKFFLWWLSNIVVLVGSAAYTWVKQQEMKVNFRNAQRSPKKTPPENEKLMAEPMKEDV